MNSNKLVNNTYINDFTHKDEELKSRDKIDKFFRLKL